MKPEEFKIGHIYTYILDDDCIFIFDVKSIDTKISQYAFYINTNTYIGIILSAKDISVLYNEEFPFSEKEEVRPATDEEIEIYNQYKLEV